MHDDDVAIQEDNQEVSMGFIGSLDGTADDVAIEMVLMSMGSSGGVTPSRDTDGLPTPQQSDGVRNVFASRVTAEPKRSRKDFRHLLPGSALDLTGKDPDDGQPWDFSKSGKRNKALRMTRRDKPSMVIGYPHCTASPTWQALSEA